MGTNFTGRYDANGGQIRTPNTGRSMPGNSHSRGGIPSGSSGALTNFDSFFQNLVEMAGPDTARRMLASAAKTGSGYLGGEIMGNKSPAYRRSAMDAMGALSAMSPVDKARQKAELLQLYQLGRRPSGGTSVQKGFAHIPDGGLRASGGQSGGGTETIAERMKRMQEERAAREHMEFMRSMERSRAEESLTDSRFGREQVEQNNELTRRMQGQEIASMRTKRQNQQEVLRMLKSLFGGF